MKDFDFKTSLDESITQMVRAHTIATELLTERQLADAIKQAIACGDFIRVICVDNDSQQVIYSPFTGHEAMRSRIAFLEQLLADNNIKTTLDS